MTWLPITELRRFERDVVVERIPGKKRSRVLMHYNHGLWNLGTALEWQTRYPDARIFPLPEVE